MSRSTSFVLLLLLAACQPGDRAPDLVPVEAPQVAYTVVRDNLAPDPDVDAIIRPYRDQYEDWAVDVVGRSGGVYSRGDPEATLDNLVADAVLEAARRLSSRPVHFAMANDGGLRADIDAGPIHVSEVFELMPFENRIAVIDLSGHQVDSLAQQIARTGGEPVAGIRFRIAEGTPRARGIEIGGEALELDRTYRVALADYLADGGGSWPQVWTPMDREDLGTLIRDAILDYVEARDEVVPYLDGRIRTEGR